MRGRSALGSSTPTWRRTNPLRLIGFIVLAVSVTVIAAFYVVESFVAPNPLLRIVMRTLPVFPLALWTLWFDKSRPFEEQHRLVRIGGRLVLLLVAMTFAIALLGIGLNWLYDPRRVF